MGVPSRWFHKHSKTRGIFDIPFSTPVKEALGNRWVRNNRKISLGGFDRWLSLPASTHLRQNQTIFSLPTHFVQSSVMENPRGPKHNRRARDLPLSLGIALVVFLRVSHFRAVTSRPGTQMRVNAPNAVGFRIDPAVRSISREEGGATERKQTRTGDRSRGRRCIHKLERSIELLKMDRRD